MLTTTLYLSAFWFILSFIPLILFGKYIKFTSPFVALSWFAIIIVAGNLLFTVSVFFNIAAILLGVFWVKLLPNWSFLAKIAWSSMFLVAIIYLIYSFGITAFATANVIGYTLALIFFFIEAFSLFLSLSYAFEALDTICRRQWTRTVPHLQNLTTEPKVSLHLPCYNEPPEVVIKTLESLSKLNYSNYEVIVIDNNTPEKSTWKPLEAACERLGGNFKFVHLEKWPGYKSGALNFALAVTAKNSEFVGIIDSDYEVDSNFLRDVIPVFADQKVAFVQTPQDYRGSATNSFFKSAYLGYKYFFNVSMPSRNERNAIIFAGTMGLIRKKVLIEIGGWDEWCITEDAEASLRILKRGYESVYINKSYGKGLMPLTFEAFKKQRFRWCFGGIQILKKHWESLMPWSGILDSNNHLTFAQKYYYMVGGLQWYNDLLNLFFAFFLILGGFLSLNPQIQGFRPFTMPLLIIPAVFLITGLWRFLWVLRITLNLSVGEAMRAMTNFFSLGWAVTLGSVQGFIQKKGIFLRTQKIKPGLKFLSALSAAQSELLIGIICFTAAIILIILRQNILIFALGTMLFWEGGLFMSAPAYSLISLSQYSIQQRPIQPETGITEGFAAKWLMVILAGITVAFLILKLTPPPQNPAPYSKFQPNEVTIPGIAAPQSSPTPSPVPTLTPLPTPSAKPSPTGTPKHPKSPSPSPTPSPSASSTPSAKPSPTGTPKPSPSVSPSLTPSPTATATPILF